jgi:toxin-antitoxin system PIN domain toxin
VILVDANILLYAEDSLSEHHELARTWWDTQLSGSAPVCLCWPVLIAFIRIGTNARLHQRPLTVKEAVHRVQSWIEQPCVRIIQPTEHHWDILQRMLQEGNATANLVSDAHLAALAVEHNCELCSSDADFARFPGLNWRNPVSAPARRPPRPSRQH